MTSEDFCSMARATIRARGVLSAPAACLRHAAASLCVFMVACGGSAGAASPLGVAAAGSAINHHQRRNSVYGIFGGSVSATPTTARPARPPTAAAQLLSRTTFSTSPVHHVRPRDARRHVGLSVSATSGSDTAAASAAARSPTPAARPDRPRTPTAARGIRHQSRLPTPAARPDRPRTPTAAHGIRLRSWLDTLALPTARHNFTSSWFDTLALLTARRHFTS